MWGDVPAERVAAVWAHELRAFGVDDVRDAMRNVGEGYPEFPPTVYQFRDLCRDAMRRRASLTAALPPPGATEQEKAEAKRRLAELRRMVGTQPHKGGTQ